jgi:hypothetical protein
MNLIRKYLWLLLPALVLAGCARNSTPPSANTPRPELKLEPARYLAKTEPGDAKAVIALRKDAKDGDAVVIVGRIGGSKKPVSEDRAVFTLVDLSLKSCDADPNCWDFT